MKKVNYLNKVASKFPVCHPNYACIQNFVLNEDCHSNNFHIKKEKGRSLKSRRYSEDLWRLFWEFFHINKVWPDIIIVPPDLVVGYPKDFRDLNFFSKDIKSKHDKSLLILGKQGLPHKYWLYCYEFSK